MQPQDNNQAPTADAAAPQGVAVQQPAARSGQTSLGVKIITRILAVSIVIGGAVIGFMAGFSWSFGSCFKQTCSPIVNYSIIWIPIATLVVTIPIAVSIFKKY